MITERRAGETNEEAAARAAAQQRQREINQREAEIAAQGKGLGARTPTGEEVEEARKRLNVPAPAPKKETPPAATPERVTAFDVETGKSFDITNRSKPKEITNQPPRSRIEPGQDTKPVEISKAVTDFARAADMSDRAAAATIARFRKNPDSPEFDRLSDRDYEALNRAADLNIKQTTVDVGGQLFDHRAWNELPEKYQSIAIRQGLPAMEKAIKNEQIQFKKDYVQLPDGNYMARSDIRELRNENKELHDTLIRKGYNAYLKQVKEVNKAIALENFKVQHAGQEIRPATGKERKIDTRSGEEKLMKTSIDVMVPGVYTVTEWNNMSVPKRAINLAVDVLALFGLGQAIRAGSRTVSTAGKLARLKAGMMAGGEFAGDVIKAPVMMIAHPVQTAKTAGREIRNLGEILLNPKRIPEASITTAEGTVRLRITDVTTAAEAIKIRDQLMRLAAKGEKPVVEFGGYRVELAQSPLVKTAGGGLTHTTPQGEFFEGGTIVTSKKGMPAAEQGLFVANEPLPRFATSSAFGKTGDKPMFYITSAETAQKAIPTGKIYRGTAEMELKFPVGTKLSGEGQRLFTRIGPTGDRVEILLEKPLTAGQVAKLKAQGLIEEVMSPFKPAITVKKLTRTAKAAKGLTPTQIKKLAKVFEEAGYTDQARNLERAFRLSTTQRRAAIQITRASSIGTSRAIRVNIVTPRTPARIIKPAKLPRTIKAVSQASSPALLQIRARLAVNRGSIQKVRAAIRETESRLDEMARDSRPGDDTVLARARVDLDRAKAELKRLKREQRAIKRETPRVASPPARPEAPERPRTPRTPRRITTPPRTPKTPRRPGTPERPNIPRIPGRPPAGPPKVPPVKPPGKGKSDKEWAPDDIRAAIAWKDGFNVIAIKPPYRRGIDEMNFNINNVPPGLTLLKTYTGEGSQGKSIKRATRELKIAAARGKLPKKITVDVGNQDVIIETSGDKIKLRHRSDRRTRTVGSNTIKRKGYNISRKLKRGVYSSNIGGSQVLSRRPLRGY